SMSAARFVHTATLLPNGRVLVIGGLNSSGTLPSAELYDPSTGGWSATGSMSVARWGHAATLLSNGQVLVSGGLSSIAPVSALASAEVYDPSSGSWFLTGSMSVGRDRYTATLLPNGKVLVVGGESNTGSFFHEVASAELYDPSAGGWTPTSSMSEARFEHT